MPHVVHDQSAHVVVLPDASWTQRIPVIARIEEAGYPVLDLRTPLESKIVCAALLESKVTPPLVIVAHGDACHLLPAVALSLRTQHRDTAGYVLVDPDAPPSTDIWPESPVTVVSTTQPSGTSLRGWPIVSAGDDTPLTVSTVVTRVFEG